MTAHRDRISSTTCSLIAALGVAVCLLAAVPAHAAKTVLLPWIAQTRSAHVRSSTLYVFQPGPGSRPVTITMRRRGTPEDNPPKATRAVAGGQTDPTPATFATLFGQPDQVSFLVLTVDGDVTPVVSAAITTSGPKAHHVVQGIPVDGAAGPGQAQFFAGLNQGSGTISTLFVMNPGPDSGQADVIYRSLAGSALATTVAALLPGEMRQLDPPAVAGSTFTIEMRVRTGRLLGVDLVTHAGGAEAAYVVGATR
jgi:hypothetical protein